MKDDFNKIRAIIGPGLVKKGYRRLPVWLISSLLDLIGVIGLMPVLYLAFNVEEQLKYPVVNSIYDFFATRQLNPEVGLIVFALFSYSLLMVFLASFRTFGIWTIQEYVEDVRRELSKNLFEKTLAAKYEFFIRNRVSDLEKEILAEVDQLVTSAIKPLISLFISAISISFVVIFLLFYNYKIAIVLVLISLFVVLSLKKTFGEKSRLLGEIRRDCNKDRFKTVGETFRNIISVKTLGLEQECFDSYAESTWKLKSSLAAFFTINAAPGAWLETMLVISVTVVFGLIGITAPQILFGQDILAVAGVYIFALLKIKPNLQVISTNISSLYFSKKLVHEFTNIYVENETVGFKNCKKYKYGKSDVRNVGRLDIIDVSLAIPGGVNLEHCNLTIRKGEMLFIKGMSGTGKSTFLKWLVGLLGEAQGTVNLGSRKQVQADERLALFGQGYLGSSSLIKNDTIYSNVTLSRSVTEQELIRFEKCCEDASCLDFIRTKHGGKEHVLTEWGTNISEGQKQRIALARMLYLDSPIFLLDEATSAVDPNTEKKIFEKLKSGYKNKIMVVVSHRPDLLKFADHILDFDKIISRD